MISIISAGCIAAAALLVGVWIGSNWPEKRCCPPHEYEKVEADDLFPFFFCLRCGDIRDPIDEMRIDARQKAITAKEATGFDGLAEKMRRTEGDDL